MTMQFAVDVSGADVVSRLMLKLERLRDVLEVRRRSPASAPAPAASVQPV